MQHIVHQTHESGWSMRKTKRNLLHSNLSPLVTVPVTPIFVHWRIHSGTCEQWHSLKTLALCSPEYVLHVAWRHLLQIIPEKCPFSIGASTQCLIRTNHWDPQKGARPLALCPRTTLAPTKFGNDFWQTRTHMFFPFRSWSLLREKIHLIEVESHHLSLTSILSSFSEIMSIHNGRLGALNLPPFSIYKSLSSCIRQAGSGVMLVVIMLVWSDSKGLEA